MSKNNETAHVATLEGLFGTSEVEVKSRGEGTSYKGPVAGLSVAGALAALQAGVADLLNGKAMATLTKPGKDDFSDDAEYNAALAEYTAEKESRKAAMWTGLHTGTLPEFSAKSWVSPLRQEIDRIVFADLSNYFAGQTVRDSAPKSVYAMPDRKSKTYTGLAEKWSAKYGDVIKAEAAHNIANGVKSEVATAQADLEF